MTISPVLMFLLQSSIAVSIYLVAWHYDAHCFTPRFQHQFLYPAAFVSAMVLMRAVNLLDIPLLNLLYTTVSLFVLCLALYRCNFQQAFVRVMPYVLVCLFCDPFSILLPAILSHHSIAEVQQSNTLSLLCCSINVLLFLFAYQIFTMLTLRYKAVTLSLQKICFLIGLIVGEVFALEAMMQMMEDSTDTIWLLLAITGFLCVDIYAAFVIYQDSRIQQEKTALELAKKQNKIQLDYYRTLGKNYQDSRILLHDMKKHLAVVEGLLQQENATAAQPYFQELYQNVNNLFQGFHCTNPILSIVMGQKISEAEEADIHISRTSKIFRWNFWRTATSRRFSPTSGITPLPQTAPFRRNSGASTFRCIRSITLSPLPLLTSSTAFSTAAAQSCTPPNPTTPALDSPASAALWKNTTASFRSSPVRRRTPLRRKSRFPFRNRVRCGHSQSGESK